MTAAGSGSFGGACPYKRARFRRVAVGGVVVLCLTAAACGGSSATSKVPPAQRVCSRAQHATRAVIGPMTLQITDPDPANIECLLRSSAVKVDMVAQASPQAWTQYDTTVVHQVQAFGSGPTHTESEIPQNVSIAGANAAWIPAQHQLVATNGTESSGGSYVTVSVTGASPGGGGPASLARAVAAAILPVAPRGTNPGPPPS